MFSWIRRPVGSPRKEPIAVESTVPDQANVAKDSEMQSDLTMVEVDKPQGEQDKAESTTVKPDGS